MKFESSVEVAVDPMTAFIAFTDEMEQWWGNGPIDAWDFARTTGRRIEPGVGGRVLEVYANDALELARVTEWHPGRRLAWRSSVDDVTVEVDFEPRDGGTLVRVMGTVAAGGRGEAGLAIVRVVPQWLPRYFARGRRPWQPLDPLMIVVHYGSPLRAARWLCDAFSFEPTMDLPGEWTDHSWIELRLGSSAVVVQRLDGANATSVAFTHEIMLFVADLDAHFDRAERAGATIVQPIKTHGFTAYIADDLEGRRWVFAQGRAGR